MFENKKNAIILALLEILALILLAGYPALRNKINESRRKEISLAQEQYDAPAVTPEKNQLEQNALAVTGTDVQSAVSSLTLSEILFSLEGDLREFQVSPWMNREGTCYLFLPGFARGKGLILESAPGGSLFIDGKEIREGDILKGISQEQVCPLSINPSDSGETFRTELVFLCSSDLPVLSLSTLSGSMELVNADKEYSEEGSATVYDMTGGKLFTGGMESIRGRGNSTWGLAKKPYQIKLTEETALFDFGRARSFNLLANGYDETRLRNQIALELASELGMRYVPKGQMVDLYIDGSYQGNYFLTEKIRVDEDGVAIRDMEELVEEVYSPQELEKVKLLQNENGTRKWAQTGLYGEESSEDISGGYLLERELMSRFKTEISGFVTDQGDCYTLQSPLYASEEQVNYIADLMQEFQDACEEEDGIHPFTGKHYSEYIDVDSFVQKYLVEEISKNYDGGVTSSFFYKPQDSLSTKIFAGPVWDYDVAFGNCNLDKIASNPDGITKLSDHVYGTDIFVKLYEKKDFYERIVEMYEKKALPFLSALLEGGIDEMAAHSRDSARMDSIRWEELENRYQYYEDYDNDIRYLKYFLEERRDFLNRIWLDGELFHNISFVMDGEIWQIFCVKDGETPGEGPIPFRYNSTSLFIGWATEDGVPYDRYKPVYEDMTFYASWQELPSPTGSEEAPAPVGTD